MPWLRVRPQLGNNIQDAQGNKIQCTIIKVLTVPRMQQHKYKRIKNKLPVSCRCASSQLRAIIFGHNYCTIFYMYLKHCNHVTLVFQLHECLSDTNDTCLICVRNSHRFVCSRRFYSVSNSRKIGVELPSKMCAPPCASLCPKSDCSNQQASSRNRKMSLSQGRTSFY
jgi:hypothetical protein